MLHLLQIDPSKVLTTSPVQIENSWQLSLLELPPCRKTVTPSSDMYISTVQSGPSSANAALSAPNLLSPVCPFYIFFLCPLTTIPCFWLSFCASWLLSLPDSLRVLQWNAGGLRARSTKLLHFLSSHPVDLICIQESNLNSFSGFLDSLLCVLIALTPGLAFSFMMPRTLDAALSSSGRAYPFLNFLSPLFLRLIPTQIM